MIDIMRQIEASRRRTMGSAQRSAILKGRPSGVEAVSALPPLDAGTDNIGNHADTRSGNSAGVVPSWWLQSNGHLRGALYAGSAVEETQISIGTAFIPVIASLRP